jgi:hypothetical protein
MGKLRAMVHTNAKNSLENAKNARLNKKKDELVVKFAALVCTSGT